MEVVRVCLKRAIKKLSRILIISASTCTQVTCQGIVSVRLCMTHTYIKTHIVRLKGLARYV